MQRRTVLTVMGLKAADVARAAGVNHAKVGNTLAGWTDLRPHEAKAVARLIGKAAAQVFGARDQEERDA